MWQPNPFAGPVGSFVGPVPVPGVDPLSGDCSIIRLNNAWLPYIRGALSQLLLQSTWDTDANGLALVTQQATNLIDAFNQLEPGDCSPQPAPVGIAESEYEMSLCEQLRFQDGKLQALCCGKWTDILGQGPTGNVVGTQPGGGSPLPPPNGGEAQYCGALAGPNVWMLPVNVSSGDTLLFNNLQGAWNDDREVIWNCPDGWVYAVGVCGQTLPHGAPDPLPTALHMQIVAYIDGNFYDVLQVDPFGGNPTTWTVPGGITDKQVILQANVDDIAHVRGEVTFCVTVTNEQAGSWEHTFNLAGGLFGWSVRDMGNYVGGSGFADGSVIYAPNHYRGADIQLLAFPSRQLTRIRWTADSVAGVGALDVGVSITLPGAYFYAPLLVAGVHQYDTGLFGPTTTTQIYIDQIVGIQNGADPGGSCLITQVIVNGVGTDPF